MCILFNGALFGESFWNGGLKFFEGFGMEFLNALLNGIYSLLSFLLGWVNIPAFPERLKGSINSFLDLIFDNLDLLGFFIRPSTIKLIVPLFIVFYNFEYIYRIVMWIFNKAVDLFDAVK